MIRRTPTQDAARILLQQMALISEAPAANLNSDPGKDKPTTRPPTAPPEYERIVDVWHGRFMVCWDEEPRLRVAVECARIELSHRKSRKPILVSTDEHGLPVLGPDGQPVRQDTWESENRVIEWHRGRLDEEAARIESIVGSYCSVAYIRRLRQRNGCDPKHGLPQPPRERWRERAWEIRAQHPNWGARRIARELNVAVSTVQELLKRPDQEAA